MNIGYACQTVGIPFTNLRTCTQKNATDENLTDIIAYNLDSLNNMLDYNLKMDIKLFRISSDLIPFGSSPVNTLKWYKIFEDKFIRMGKKARFLDKKNGLNLKIESYLKNIGIRVM